MDVSLLLAKIIGLYGLIVSISALLNRQRLQFLVNDFLKNEALMYLSALLALSLGLIIINIHQVIAYDYRLIITLFGWMSFIQGVIHLLVPEAAYSVTRRLINYDGLVFFGILIVLASSLWLLKEGLGIQI